MSPAGWVNAQARPPATRTAAPPQASRTGSLRSAPSRWAKPSIQHAANVAPSTSTGPIDAPLAHRRPSTASRPTTRQRHRQRQQRAPSEHPQHQRGEQHEPQVGADVPEADRPRRSPSHCRAGRPAGRPSTGGPTTGAATSPIPSASGPAQPCHSIRGTATAPNSHIGGSRRRSRPRMTPRAGRGSASGPSATRPARTSRPSTGRRWAARPAEVVVDHHADQRQRAQQVEIEVAARRCAGTRAAAPRARRPAPVRARPPGRAGVGRGGRERRRRSCGARARPRAGDGDLAGAPELLPAQPATGQRA